jgi:hypothetical protein
MTTPQTETGTVVTTVYKASIAAGAGVAVFLYGVIFDDLSETTLVRLTPTWFFPLVFGFYGLLAEKLFRLIREGKADNLAAAVSLWTRAIGVSSLIPLFPFLFLKGKNSVTVAFWGAAVWAVLLSMFFELIFPML